MTENIVNGFNAAGAILQQGAKVGGFKKGAEAINLAKIWEGFGIVSKGNN